MITREFLVTALSFIILARKDNYNVKISFGSLHMLMRIQAPPFLEMRHFIPHHVKLELEVQLAFNKGPKDRDYWCWLYSLFVRTCAIYTHPVKGEGSGKNSVGYLPVQITLPVGRERWICIGPKGRVERWLRLEHLSPEFKRWRNNWSVKELTIKHGSGMVTKVNQAIAGSSRNGAEERL